MANLGATNDNINIDGAIEAFTDFGGSDIYTILPSLSGNVTITDVQASTIRLPEGLDVTAALFLADGLQFTVNNFTVTFLGAPQDSTYVFGGTPLDANAGTPLNFEDTAAAFGTTVPAPGEDANEATQTGAVNLDGTVGDGGFSLPDDPGASSPDGIFFENVFFGTATGNDGNTPQGLLALETTVDIFAATGMPSSFIVKNAELTVGDDLQIGNGESIFSLSGPSTIVSLPGIESSGSSLLQISTSEGRSTDGAIFISDGAQVMIDHPSASGRPSIDIATNLSPEIEDGELRSGGQSVVGTLVVEGDQTTVSVMNTAGGDRGGLEIARISAGEDGVVDTTTNRSADGLVIIRDGAEVSVRNFVGIANANSVEGATANGLLIVEGQGTVFTAGVEGNVGNAGFMRIAEGGGTGDFLLRDGAEFRLLAGGDGDRAGIQLSGGSDREGGIASAVVSGNGTQLFVEVGNIAVGRNIGEASLTVSDGASVIARDITTANNSIGTTTIQGAGTIVTLSDGNEGFFDIARVDENNILTQDAPQVVGSVTISDGATVNVASSSNIGDANGVAGASAVGTLTIEGQGTSVTYGGQSGVGRDGFIRLAEEGGEGHLILRGGATFSLLSGEEFGGGMQLSGSSDRDGGIASAEISGEGTRLAIEKGSVEVGRNTGSSTFTVSDGADVEALFFTSGRDGTAATIFEGEGTSLNLAGAQVNPEFGAFLTVGRAAEGSFLLRDGADITITGDGGQFPGFQVGRDDGAVGTLTVTGAGSTLTIDGADNIDVNGGETGFIRAGNNAGSSGTINVLDAGMITNDADGILIVADNDGSTGIVNVDGTGSVFDFGADAYISEDAPGARGNAIVTVSNGGRLAGDQITNNGILDVTSGGQLNANLIQDNILRSSSGIEDLIINGDLTVNTAGFGFDFAIDGNGDITHDTYTATGAVNLDGNLIVLANSLLDLSGFAVEIISGSSLTVSDGFSVQFVEIDANSIDEVDSAALVAAAGNAVDLEFTTTSTGLIVDFTPLLSANQIVQAVGIADDIPSIDAF